MGRQRRALLRKLLDQRKQIRLNFVFLKSRTGPPAYFGAVVQGVLRGRSRRATDAEIEAAKQQNLTAWERKQAEHARAVHEPAQPTLQPAAVRTRLAKCSGCGFRTEVPASDDAPGTCPRCGRSDL